jgi:hypothetical protein
MLHMRFAQHGSIAAPHAWQLTPIPPNVQAKPVLQVPSIMPLPPQHGCPMPPHVSQVPPPPWPVHPRPVLHIPPMQQA